MFSIAKSMAAKFVTPFCHRLTPSGAGHGCHFQRPQQTHRLFSTRADTPLAPLQEKSPASFTTPANLKQRSTAAIKYFSRKFDQLEKRHAFTHAFFESITAMATEPSFGKDLFSCIRYFMLARLHVTMPLTLKLSEYAMRTGDYPMCLAALHKFNLECGDGDSSKMHAILAEQAFNEIARQFGLPDITPKQAFDTLILKSDALKQYVNVLGKIYNESPAFACLAQHVASGGGGSSGITADLYNFFDTLRPQMIREDYEKNVMPFFRVHLQLKPDGSFRGQPDDSVVRERGQRILEQALEQVSDMPSAAQGLRDVEACINAQAILFDTAEMIVRDIAEKSASRTPGSNSDPDGINWHMRRVQALKRFECYP